MVIIHRTLMSDAIGFKKNNSFVCYFFMNTQIFLNKKQ